MLGIGITTYNRIERVRQTIEQVIKYTEEPFTLVIADDGSVDGTEIFLKSLDHGSICGDNRGVAWNKNRCLFFLHALRGCRTIILLEDDCSPTMRNWERPWIEAADRFGHANIAGPWFGRLFEPGGAGTPDNPFVCSQTSAQCSVFSAEALAVVGYMDTRFGRYGFEHADHTKRMLRAGYGGEKGEFDHDDRNFLIAADGLYVDCLDAPIDHPSLQKNGAIYEQIKRDPIYRNPWRTPEEWNVLRSEMVRAGLIGRRHETANDTPRPSEPPVTTDLGTGTT